MRRGHFIRGGKVKGGTFSENVHSIRYTHTDDGKDYEHKFEKGVRMTAEADGEIRISHPTKPVWGVFDA